MQLPQLRVGRIPFLVCLPYFHNENVPNVAYVDGTPRQLNKLFVKGLVDAAPTSSIHYAHYCDDLWITPQIGTSSLLEIHSVLLCSKFPLEQLSGRKVGLSMQSDTSVLLFRLLCKRYLKISPILVDDPASECDACVLIGDEALRSRHQGGWPYVYELDRLWRDWKGLPFVFGLWTLQKAFVATPAGQAVYDMYFEHLKDSVASFPLQVTQALDEWQQRYGLPIPMDLCRDFLARIDYGFDEDRVESLGIFYKECYLAGYLPKLIQPKFWTPTKD